MNGAADALDSSNIVYMYHEHTLNCESICYVDRITVIANGGKYQATCPACGERGSSHAECYNKYVHDCGTTTTESFLKCGSCSKYFMNNQVYNAPSAGTTSNYSNHTYYACGKTEETVESAIIEFIK